MTALLIAAVIIEAAVIAVMAIGDMEFADRVKNAFRRAHDLYGEGFWDGVLAAADAHGPGPSEERMLWILACEERNPYQEVGAS